MVRFSCEEVQILFSGLDKKSGLVFFIVIPYPGMPDGIISVVTIRKNTHKSPSNCLFKEYDSSTEEIFLQDSEFFSSFIENQQ